MANITIRKTQDLLQQAARQNDSQAPGESSVTGATREFPSAAKSEQAFARFHKKLLRVENWNACSNVSSFELFDQAGDAQSGKLITVGDFLKVTLPGSGKDDWVKIAAIHDTATEIILTIQPSHDPTDAKNEETVSHFFTDASTNNFCLQRQAATINFYVIGLNEQTNTQQTSGVLETARNYATANLGYFFGIQKMQWKTFCENFLEIEK